MPMARAEISLEIESHEETVHEEKSLVKHYRASKAVPCTSEHELKYLLKRGIPACAAIQACCGILTLGLGLVFAISMSIGESLMTLFRVPIISGITFIVAGMLTMFLRNHPELLHVCLVGNILCLSVSGISTALLVVDLLLPGTNERLYQMEVLVLCMILMDLTITAVLLFWFHKERKEHRK
ncbi:hypothetical protein DNTS_011796 [Danionella cerebrum]|uniref:Uncharacterized protein n=1 Tax=Danionella cerebrum TaxID=2873325 RepID=A0A553P5E0_9TELE|nr:hypothetical protein DNTS_011796 [Danionella translucida]